MALRPRARAGSMSSRYGSQALAVGARLVGGGQPERSARAADGPPKSVDTSLAGFGAGGRRRRGRRTGIPAAFRYALAVSRRTPVAASMRRSGQPSRPNARTCCCLSSPKMLVMSAGRPQPPRRRQRLGARLPHWPVFRCPRLAGFGCPPRLEVGLITSGDLSAGRHVPGLTGIASMDAAANQVGRAWARNASVLRAPPSAARDQAARW